MYDQIDQEVSPSLEYNFDIELDEETTLKLKFPRKDMVERHENGPKPNNEESLTVNIGSEEVGKEVKIGTSLSNNHKKDRIPLLKEFPDVFAWSYKDMPGILLSTSSH